MGVAEMLAGRVSVERLDLVDEAVVEEEVERAIDGRGRDLLAVPARQFLQDRIGAERGDAVAEDVEHPAPQRRELHFLAQAGEFDARRPIGGVVLATAGVRGMRRERLGVSLDPGLRHEEPPITSRPHPPLPKPFSLRDELL
jgi:hypothetical protein